MRKLHLAPILFILFTILSTSVFAAQDVQEKTVRLSVENMTCVTCPLTVRFSLQQIDGVTFADADLETESAIATFYPNKTNIEALTKATANVGYPSKLKEVIKQ